MATPDKPVEVVRVSCEVCLKEVPIAEAKSVEASDYFAYFCGLECYEKWKAQDGKAEQQARKPGA